MKILFLIASMRGGGAERVAANLCNHWVNNGNEVVLVTFDDPANDFYVIDSKIVRHSLECFKTSKNKLEKIASNLQRIGKMRKIVRNEQPDVVVSFMDVANVLAILSCLGLKVPVVVSERTYPPYYNDNNLFDKVRKFIYKFSDAFVAQTSNVGDWAAKFLNTQKINVIANPVDVKHVEQTSARENVILAMGRLGHEKGFDMLIQAFAQAHAIHPAWSLRIVGEGAERQNLSQQIEALGLQHKVLLPGQTTSPHAEFAKAKIFSLSSRVEGFPNVLLEAMAHGMPALSFDCNSGPRDIIEHEVNGLLVQANDPRALTAAMTRLITDATLRDKLARSASNLRHKYSLENISSAWLELFTKVAK